jgi:hypothetical protein
MSYRVLQKRSDEFAAFLRQAVDPQQTGRQVLLASPVGEAGGDEPVAHVRRGLLVCHVLLRE